MVSIMLTKTQEDILAFLISKPEEQFTIRGIARELKKSYTLVYNNISDLEKNDLIIKEDVPPAKIIKLNEFIQVDVLVDIERKRKKEFLKKNLWVRVMLDDILLEVKDLFFILLVFGSYAKGSSTKKSDLDLLIIVQDKKDIKKIEEAVNRVYTKVKKGISFVDVADFKEMIINNKEFNVGNEARKYHLILHGAEMYYHLIK